MLTNVAVAPSSDWCSCAICCNTLFKNFVQKVDDTVLPIAPHSCAFEGPAPGHELQMPRSATAARNPAHHEPPGCDFVTRRREEISEMIP